jgi:hypothetical protein
VSARKAVRETGEIPAPMCETGGLAVGKGASHPFDIASRPEELRAGGVPMRRYLPCLLVPIGFALVAPAGPFFAPHNESAKQLVAAAAKALASANSVRISGTISESSGPEGVDVVIYGNRDLKGSLILDGDLVQITVVNGTDYYKASSAYWQKSGAPEKIAKQLAPDWLSTPNSSSSGLGDSLQLGYVSSQLASNTDFKIVGREKVDGQSAVGVSSSNGGVLWIAASGKPYPISETKKGNGGGTLSFSGWNTFKLPTAPKGAIAMSSL